MATAASGPSYGLDADLEAKKAANYDEGLEKEVTNWIEAITGEPKGDVAFGEWLHDGKVLCHLANKIKPGSVKKINESKMVFKQRENITYFQNFCRDLGVAEISMFSTDDLFDQKNMGSVIQSINMLGGVIQHKLPDFDGPKLGVAVHNVVEGDKKRQVGVVTQTGGLSNNMEVQKLCAGKREVAGGTNEGVRAPGEAGADAQGLDADIAAKRAAKLAALKPLDDDIVKWIEAITGESRGSQSTAAWLKNGQVLCRLANKVKPGAVADINTMAAAFKERENITYFQKAMRDIGVPESSLFGTDDLYEERDFGTFLLSVGAYAGAVQTSGFSGPALGPAISHHMEDVKRDGLTATSQFVAMEQAMQVERPKQTGITAGADAGK